MQTDSGSRYKSTMSSSAASWASNSGIRADPMCRQTAAAATGPPCRPLRPAGQASCRPWAACPARRQSPAGSAATSCRVGWPAPIPGAARAHPVSLLAALGSLQDGQRPIVSCCSAEVSSGHKDNVQRGATNRRRHARPEKGTVTVSCAPHPPVLLIQVQRGARVVHGRVLARLDGQPQVLGRQVAQRARLEPPPGRRRAHERREARRVAHVLPRVAQLQRLRVAWSQQAASHRMRCGRRELQCADYICLGVHVGPLQKAGRSHKEIVHRHCFSSQHYS